ncbi:hypothetical protein ACQJBY_060298 [Aegilops geniculata]
MMTTARISCHTLLGILEPALRQLVSTSARNGALLRILVGSYFVNWTTNWSDLKGSSECSPFRNHRNTAKGVNANHADEYLEGKDPKIDQGWYYPLLVPKIHRSSTRSVHLVAIA